ncbi:MAG: acyltransferase family protein [bacterium]
MNGERRGPDPAYAAAGDLLRVLSVALIAWFHIWQQSWLSPTLNIGGHPLSLMPWVRTGYMLVDLMLVLSGFLAYLPYANRAERPAREFYIRRALRILPSYWLCLAVMVAFTRFENVEWLMKDLLAHLGFVHNFWGFSYTATRLNGVLWTLAVEVQFYLLLPALAPVFRKHPILTWCAMTGAGLSFMFLWTLPMPDTTLYFNRLPNMLVVYANGMLAAHAYAALAKVERHRVWIALAGTLICAASVWGIAVMLRIQSHVSDYNLLRAGQIKWRWPLSACGAGFLVGGSLSFGPVRAVMSNPFVRFLSGISYNFYIWHQWLAVKLKQWRIPPYVAAENPNFAGEMPWQLQYTVVCFVAGLAVAAAVTYVIERPCARMGRKRLI